jgi:hypothetical protein
MVTNLGITMWSPWNIIVILLGITMVTNSWLFFPSDRFEKWQAHNRASKIICQKYWIANYKVHFLNSNIGLKDKVNYASLKVTSRCLWTTSRLLFWYQVHCVTCLVIRVWYQADRPRAKRCLQSRPSCYTSRRDVNHT